MESPKLSAGLARTGILVLALAIVSPLFFRAPIVETDLWWHLATGREITARSAVPTTDPFSFTFAGKEWMSHEWLWDVAAWLAYQADPDGVAWFNVAVLLALFAATYGCCLTLGAKPADSLVATVIAAAGAHWFLSIRPELFSTLFVSLIVLTRDRRWAPFLWPPLIVVWVNLHGGFVVGIGAIGLLVLVRTLQASTKAKRLVIDRRAWIAVGLCLVAWLVNPWGWSIAGYPLDYLGDTAYREIGEWHAPDFGLDPRTYEGQFALSAILAALGAWLAGRRDPYPVALAGVTFAMASTSRRFIPLFLVTAAPLVAVLAADIRRQLRERFPALRARAVAIGAVAVALALAAFLWSVVRIGPDPLGSWTGIDRFPQSALRYAQAIGSPQRVLNSYDWGGYITLHAPEIKVFFDSRANTLYDEAILHDYLKLMRADADTSSIVARYTPDAALIPPGPLVAALEAASPPWSVVYDDGIAVLLLPRDSLLARSMPHPHDALPHDPGPELISARESRAAGDLGATERHLRQAVTLQPLLVQGYADLARTALARRDLNAAAAAIKEGIGNYPRQAQRLRFYQGQAYLEAGQPALALAALQSAYPRGPFGPRPYVAALIHQAQVELLGGVPGE